MKVYLENYVNQLEFGFQYRFEDSPPTYVCKARLNDAQEYEVTERRIFRVGGGGHVEVIEEVLGKFTDKEKTVQFMKENTFSSAEKYMDRHNSVAPFWAVNSDIYKFESSILTLVDKTNLDGINEK